MEKGLQKVDARFEDTGERPERRRRKPIRPKMEKDYTERLQEVTANEHKIDGRVPVVDTKGPPSRERLAQPREAPSSRRSPKSPRQPPPPDSRGGRKRKSRKGGGGRIDSDPFMRCFLREVDTNACDAEEDRPPSDGSVLYLYPIVEYRPGDEEGEVSDDDEGETFPAPKVFLYSPSDGGSPNPQDYDEGYRCAVCDDTFPDGMQLRDHMLCMHVDERGNRCEACGLSFETAFRARSHVMAEHVDLDCRYCLGRFPDGSSLRRHTAASHGDAATSDPKRCEVCLEAFATPAELAAHVECEHASLLEHRCDLCSRTFLDEDELFAHVDRDPHVCLLCSAYFDSTLKLRQHLLGHATDRRVLQLFTATEMPAS